MKRIICTGTVDRDGRIVIARPTLDEQIAINEAQIARNRATLAEIDAMHADLDALLAGKPVGYRLTAAQVEEIENEQPGEECRWLW